MTSKTAEALNLRVAPPAPAYPIAPSRATGAVSLHNDDHMASMHRLAVTMASGRATVPQHLQGNVGDCLAVVLQAERWGMSPFVVAQKTHLVQGTLGYEAQLVAAVVNTSSVLTERMRYEWFGEWQKIVGKFKTMESRTKKDEHGHPKKYIVPAWDPKDEEGLGVRVSATLRGENEPRVLELLMTQARTRNSTLWTEDPKQQIAYLASKRWSRLHAPELILGVYTPDEFAAPTHMGFVQEVAPEIPEELLKAGRDAADKGRAAFGEWWDSIKITERRMLNKDAELMDDMRTRCTEADARRTVDNPAQTPAAAPTNAPTAAPTQGAAPRSRPRPAPPAPPAPAAPAQTAAAPTGAPTFTADAIRTRLEDASDLDALYIAADLINHVSDPSAIADLEAFFEERRESFGE